MAGVIVVDASWIVALRDEDDVHHRRAVETFAQIADEDAVLHPVTLAECLVAPARMGVMEEAAALLRASFDVTGMDLDAPLRWAQLRAATGLRLPDAIVLDTALHQRARAVATFDEQLAARACTRGLEVLGATAA